MAKIPPVAWIIIGIIVSFVSWINPDLRAKMTLFGIIGIIMILYGVVGVFTTKKIKQTPAQQPKQQSKQQQYYQQQEQQRMHQQMQQHQQLQQQNHMQQQQATQHHTWHRQQNDQFQQPQHPVCPNCHQQKPSQYRFCPHCGYGV